MGVLLLAACNKGSAPASGEQESVGPNRSVGALTSPSKEPDKKRIGLSVPTTIEDFGNEIATGARICTAGVAGVELVVSAPVLLDPPTQFKLLQAVSPTVRGGLGIMNLAPDLFAKTMGNLVAEGRRVLTVDTSPPPGTNIELHVGNDNYAAGRVLGEELVRRLPPKTASGEIVIGTSVQHIPVLDERVRGMRDALTAKLPKVSVVGPLSTDMEPTQNYTVWSGIVKAHPDAIAFLGTGDQDTYNLSALKEQTKGNFFVGGFDIAPSALSAVKRGVTFAAMSPEHLFKGCVSMRLLAEAVRDDKPLAKGWIDTGHLLVNPDNVEEILARQASEEAKARWLLPRLEAFLKDLAAHTKPLSEAK